MHHLFRHALRPALSLWLVMTVITGVVYPAIVTGLAQWWWPWQANGSLLRDPDGVIRASALIAQPAQRATDFQPRPSATDWRLAGASNLAVSNPQRRADAEDRQAASPMPLSAAMLSASASGLDPDLPLADALAQVPAVAAARHQSPQSLAATVNAQATDGRLGPRVVNVMLLNWRQPIQE